ncbi:polysaccharide deacetylase family protein [Allomuricauda sp. R78024]|uniref:polysaccharide deacetylase family protein n=1 Tax=Allomuricauda sp. R78024 TaxID=3093867 RepID=UPI0037C8DBE2
MEAKGKFVISLDFELFWGVRDKRSLDSYGDSIAKVHQILPELLSLFEKYEVRATFATVGFLFAKNKTELVKYSPDIKPTYKDLGLSPYEDNFKEVKQDSKEDPYHYAPELIELIKKSSEHEIGSHTFSHYYCQENGQTPIDFGADMKAAVRIAKEKGVSIKSLVFPRNQSSKEHLKVCIDNGIKIYRGNEEIWFHRPESEEKTSLMKRVFRTLDCYINISGHHTYTMDDLSKEKPYNLPSSRFLRPYKAKTGILLEKLKLARIKRGMSYAAKNDRIYHLWWHPHNFGTNTNENFSTLNEIMKHYRKLNKVYGFQSITMAEVASSLDKIIKQKSIA